MKLTSITKAAKKYVLSLKTHYLIFLLLFYYFSLLTFCGSMFYYQIFHICIFGLNIYHQQIYLMYVLLFLKTSRDCVHQSTMDHLACHSVKMESRIQFFSMLCFKTCKLYFLLFHVYSNVCVTQNIVKYIYHIKKCLPCFCCINWSSIVIFSYHNTLNFTFSYRDRPNLRPPGFYYVVCGYCFTKPKAIHCAAPT